MSKITLPKIVGFFLIAAGIYFLTTPIFIKNSNKKYTIEDFEIEIDIKNCINCPWLDPTVKKIIKISNQNNQKVFKPTSPTEVDKTRIILGKSKVDSKFNQAGINQVIFFPNELEKLEAFDFETGEDLNKKGDGRFMYQYYSDTMVKNIVKEIDVEFDVTLN